jgi:hypothetical protein
VPTPDISGPGTFLTPAPVPVSLSVALPELDLSLALSPTPVPVTLAVPVPTLERLLDLSPGPVSVLLAIPASQLTLGPTYLTPQPVPVTPTLPSPFLNVAAGPPVPTFIFSPTAWLAQAELTQVARELGFVLFGTELSAEAKLGMIRLLVPLLSAQAQQTAQGAGDGTTSAIIPTDLDDADAKDQGDI